MRWLRRVPEWLVSGALIFPVVAAVSILAGVITDGRVSYLFWLVLPSIVFEEALETWAYAASNSIVANLTFAVAFWFAIGACLGLLRKLILGRQETAHC